MVKKVLFLFCFLLLFVGYTFSQKRVNDAIAWLSVSLEQKVYKKISGRLMSRIRQNENFSQLKSYYFDLGLFYNFNYKTSISVNYVYAPSKVNYDYFRVFHQYYMSLNNRFYYGKYLFLSNRIIVQQTSHKLIVENGYKPYSRTDFREKLTLNWKPIQGYRFYLGDEIMIPVSRTPIEIRRNRLYVGINKKLAKRLSIDAYYVLQSSFHNQRQNNTNDNIFGITINYRFNNNFDF